MAAPPELIEDAVTEILLRVPPDEPADLVRASLVDRRWRRILIDPAFLRRYREFHRVPPLLGFFHNYLSANIKKMPRFVAMTGASSPLPQPEFDGEEWSALNCHHGRVLIGTGDTRKNLVVWDPITGGRKRVGPPDIIRWGVFTLYSPVVLCAAGSSCNHLDCHGGPFLVVGVGFAMDGALKVLVYSSEAGAWTNPASIDTRGAFYFDARDRILIGDEIYFFIVGRPSVILKYEVSTTRLSAFDPPELYDQGRFLVQLEDGSMGLAGSKGTSIYLWSRRKETSGEAAGWVQTRVIDFAKLLPSAKLFDTVRVIGFAEGLGVIVGTFAGTFTIELKSADKLKRICEPGGYFCVTIVPFVSFYTPADCARSKSALQEGTS